MSFWIVAAVATSTALQTYGAYSAGKADQQSAEQRANDEKIAAKDRELQRQQELSRTLAANAVSAGMSGTSGEGSQRSISLSNAKTIGASEGMIALSDRLSQQAIITGGKNAKYQGQLAATQSLIDGGLKTYKTMA